MRVTTRDIAKEAGVSQTTVSLVLNNNTNISISSETRAHVIKVAERMGVGTAECLVVGDREDTDVQLAKSVGAHYFLV